MLLLRRIIRVRQPSSVFAHGFSESPLKSLRYSSTSSVIASSPKSASPDSNSVKPENDEKPVIVLFENHGFSKTQISEIVKKFPQVLSANPEKTLLPKLLFFQSKGLSSPEIAKLVCSFPSILARSLDRKIIPAFDYIQELLQTEKRTIASIKRCFCLLTWDLQIYARPNVETLIQIGVPDSNIATILHYQPRVFLINTVRFKEIVEEVKEMGFNPLRLNFVIAVLAMRAMSKSTWRKKVEIYKKWGWSEEEILFAFRRHPWCMMASEDKINGVMDFFVNKIGYEISYIAKRPALISHSLKKRIVPRGSVYQVLLSKGLIKKDVNLPFLFEATETQFLDKFIDPHKKLIPELLKLYKEKLEDAKR
ncbi:transcription termination factor MTERF6, chloroplastic/mitochondrial-like [Cucurbita pepo subsp. pepo]|uniref:transcription termination factor MTERF6, chloroplastic/mitochondrial-like n=1 Tax=Cucurbita pepo subsp. pepo TaxID=3664 RepID=UPI000C9D597A|nr:transcription termination factor MTERF6, chloroplastic/mitochondrial-like [Cucurbita pepo subsp. pepo]